MNVWLRRLGFAVGGLVVLIVMAVGSVYALSAAAVGTGHATSTHAFDAAGGDAAEGARLAAVYGCTDCHAADLGGKLLVDGMPFARIPAPNLTAGRPGGAFTDEQFEQAVRHGVGADGRSLFIMPSAEYTYLGDEDVAAILAYIRTLAPVERELPSRSFGPVGRMVVAMGKVPFQAELIAADPNARHLAKPSAADPVQLGHYLTRLCTGCHGRDLEGAAPLEPEAPAGANLTPAGNLKNWTLEDFRTAFSTGRTPEGKQLDPNVMPWKVIGQAQPEEIAAMWAYLQTIPAKESPAVK
jgi:mono/diheme cytochrome c family protein